MLHHPILFHQTIDLDIARGIIDYVHQEQFHANLYVNDQLFTTAFNPHSAYYQKISGVVPLESKNLHDALTGPPSKMMIIDDRCDEIIAALKQQFSAHVNVCKSHPRFCEIVHHAVSKWKAIEQLLEQWNIQPEEVLAIGDHENDLPMIQGAGVGVAMGNAPDHVKAQANYVTDTVDNDGAVKAIEQFVYGHLPLEDPDVEEPTCA